MLALIQFDSYRFDLTGTPTYGERSAYESDGNGVPFAETTTYSITQRFTEDSFAENEIRYAALKSALAQGTGRFLIKDELGGVIIDRLVKVRSRGLPEAWRQHLAEVTVEFEAKKQIIGNLRDATFSSSGSGIVQLKNVTRWQESIRTDRAFSDKAHRRESIVTIAAAGQIMADEALTADQKFAFLQGRIAAYRGINQAAGTLSFGGDEHVVKVETADVNLFDGSDRVEWSFSASYHLMPSSEYAEAEYETSAKEDVEAGKRFITLSGEVRASSQSAAETKLTQLKSFFSTGRTLLNSDVKNSFADGVDGQTWGKLSFTIEFSEALTDTLSYTLNITTREDVRNADRLIVYEGRVIGSLLSSVLEKVSSLAAAQLPFMTASSRTISVKKNGQTEEELVEVTFSYEYQAKSSDWRFAEVTRNVSRDFLGEQREVISGYCAAATAEAAQSMAVSFKLTGRVLRDVRESTQDRVAYSLVAETRQLSRFDFTYTFYLSFQSTSIGYGVDDTSDYVSLDRNVSISGTAYGPTQEACNTLINTIVAQNSSGLRRTQKKRVRNVEQVAALSYLVSVSFSESFMGKVTDSNSSILDAEYSIETVFSVNRAVITPIPFGIPHVQTNCGITVGQKTISGRITALSESAARSWGRGKRGLLGGGYEDPAQERLNFVHQPLSGTDIKSYQFDFTYTARFPQLSLN